MLQPHLLTVVLWGDKHRTYFVERCLPSLLTPGNFNPDARLVLCCPVEDFQKLPPMPFATTHIPLPYPRKGVSGCIHMGIGHKAATEIAYAEKALLTLLTPDMILSDGAIGMARRKAAGGKTVVVAPALRFQGELLFKHFTTNEPRALATAALKSLHSETIRYEWDAPYILPTPPAYWWRAPGGMVLHCMSWAPLLLDYSALSNHATRAVEKHTIDGSYVHDNWGDPGDALYAVTDSDEAFVASWSMAGECDHDLKPHDMFNDRPLGLLVKAAFLREFFYHGYDAMKHRLFFKPVRWHVGAVSPAWAPVERRAINTLMRYVPRMED